MHGIQAASDVRGQGLFSDKNGPNPANGMAWQAIGTMAWSGRAGRIRQAGCIWFHRVQGVGLCRPQGDIAVDTARAVKCQESRKIKLFLIIW